MATLKELQAAVDADKKLIGTLETGLGNCKAGLANSSKPSNYGASHYDESWIASGSNYDSQWCTGNSNKKAACSTEIVVFNQKLANCRTNYNNLQASKSKLASDTLALTSHPDYKKGVETNRGIIISVVSLVVIAGLVWGFIKLKKKGVIK